MNFNPNAKDIFLWADGYWCFRENFYQQPRQDYEYVLVRTASDRWNLLRAVAALAASSNVQNLFMAPARYPDHLSRLH